MTNGCVTAYTAAVNRPDTISTVGENSAPNIAVGSGFRGFSRVGIRVNSATFRGSCARELTTEAMIAASVRMPNTRHQPPATSQRDRRIAVTTGAGSRTSAGAASAYEIQK